MPRVEKPDLLGLVFDDITDPSHEQRWANFYRDHPALAREVLKRISIRSQFGCLSIEERTRFNRAITEEVSYIAAAFEAAAKRKKGDLHATAYDGVDDEAQPL